MNSLVCPGCGARLAEGVERCDLCGTSLGEPASRAPETPDDIPEPESRAREGAPDGVFCNQCGWKNPLDAKFCSRCGSGLQDLEPGVPRVKRASLGGAVPPPAASGGNETESSAETAAGDQGLARYVAVLVGLSVLVVVALYMITVVSKQRVSTPPNQAAVEAPAQVRSAAVIDESEAIPIAEQHAPTVDSLREALADAEGADRLRIQAELVSFFLEIGRIDRAAIEQQRVALASDDIADWRRTGDLLFNWMETVDIERKTDVALLTIDAYERVLAENPDDLDVRANLGWAYQYDPQNPMQAIQNTNRVLEADPDHLVANYNRGVFLLRINRVDDAISQFEKVKQLAGPESPYSQQADILIRSVQRERDTQGSV